MQWSNYEIGDTTVRDYMSKVKVYIPENTTGPVDVILYHPGSGSGNSAVRDYDEIDSYIQTNPNQIVIRSNLSSGDEYLIGNVLESLSSEGINIGPLHSIGHSQGQIGALNTAVRAIDLGYQVADVVSLDSKESASKLYGKKAEAAKLAEKGTKLIMFDQRNASRENIDAFTKAGVPTLFIQMDNNEKTFDENHAIINSETIKNGIIQSILGIEKSLKEIPGFEYHYMLFNKDTGEWDRTTTAADALAFISDRQATTIDADETYYISDEELREALIANIKNSEETNEGIQNIFNMIKANTSNQVLDGEVWNAIKFNLQYYEDRLAFAQKLNQQIADTNDKYIKSLEEFLWPDKELNTADLEIFETEKQSIEDEIHFLEQENEQLALVPEEITVQDGYDSKTGLPRFKTIHNPAYDAAQAQIKDNNKRINDILIPARNEFIRLINKINEFNNEILPSLNRILDTVREQVDKYLKVVNEILSSSTGTIETNSYQNNKFSPDGTPIPGTSQEPVTWPNGSLNADGTQMTDIQLQERK